MSDDDQTTESDPAPETQPAPESGSDTGADRRTIDVPSWAPRALAVVGVLLIALVGFVIGRATDGDGDRDFRPAFSQSDRGPSGPGGRSGGGPGGGPGGDGRQLPGGPGGPGSRGGPDQGERRGPDQGGPGNGPDQGGSEQGGPDRQDGPGDES